jgi:hypothetical protein
MWKECRNCMQKVSCINDDSDVKFVLNLFSEAKLA